MFSGSYEIPEGLVFSQPAVLQDGKWKICPNLPIPHYTIKLRNLISFPLIISQKYGLFDNLPNIEESCEY